MPQIFQVLRCYKCLAFQVHQTKKSNKWECKLCGEKQSVKRHYGIGTAKDCRLHVQQLNSMRGEKDELRCGQMLFNCECDEVDETEELEFIKVTIPRPHPVSSKWSDYLDVPETVEDKNEPMSFGDEEVVLEIPKKRRKQLSNYGKSNRNTVLATLAVSHSKEYKTYTRDKGLKHCSSDTEHKTINHSNAEDIKTLNTHNSLENSIEKDNNQILNAYCNINIPPAISKNSKWAEYVEEDSHLKPSTGVNMSQHGHIFSLCDDSELDNILNI